MENIYFRQIPLTPLKSIPPALKTLTHAAPYALARHRVRDHQFGLASSTQTFLAGFDRPVARNDGHGAEVDAGAASDARLGKIAERRVDTAVFAAADKTDGIGMEKVPAHPHTAPAQHTIFVSEWIADILHSASHSNILNGTGVRGLGHEQFRNVFPQFPDFFCIAFNDDALLNAQSTGGGNF